MHISITGLVFLLASLLFLKLLSAVKRWQFARSYGCADPPTRHARDPIFGLDLVQQSLRDVRDGKRVKTLIETLRNYNGTFQSFPMGHRMLCTMDPTNAKAILATDLQSWGVGPGREAPGLSLMGRGVLSSDGAFWAESRAAVKPTFNRKQVADREMFDFHADRFIELLPQDDRTVDLAPLFNRLILDASSEFIFGQSFDSLLPEYSGAGREFTEAFKYAQSAIIRRRVIGRLSIFYRDAKLWESCRLVRECVGGFIDRATQHDNQGLAKEKGDSVTPRKHLLVKDLADNSSDREWLTDQLIQVFFAAQDTSAIVLTNAMFLLARHTRAWSKLRAEVQGLAPEDLTFECIKGLQYLQWIVKEVLRLHSPAPTTVRECFKATTMPLGGGPDGKQPIAVRPGTRVTIVMGGMHRDPEVYGEDADEFRPERWDKLILMWEYIPFLGGPRTCPGQQLALFWVGYTLARMAMTFKEVQNRDEVLEFVEEQRFASSCRNGAKVGLVRG